jgi:hypothetical protein
MIQQTRTAMTGLLQQRVPKQYITQDQSLV